ncbi:MAG: LAGLIDADG family homing endonuclease [Nanoarchaeota archaeon]
MQFSQHEIKRLAYAFMPEFAELVGVIIGDGNILYRYQDKFYRLIVVGDVSQDIEYFMRLKNIIFKLTGKEPVIQSRKHKKGFGLELLIYSKAFISFLVEDADLDYGNKTFIVKIPKRFTISWEIAKHVLRGIFESDGSLYFSKSKENNYPTYPRIELRTSSQLLAYQVFDLLNKNKFEAKIMKTKYGDFKIYLSGEHKLEKWMREIGFSNRNSLTKYLLWKKLGYYIPRISLLEREKLI